MAVINTDLLLSITGFTGWAFILVGTGKMIFALFNINEGHAESAGSFVGDLFKGGANKAAEGASGLGSFAKGLFGKKDKGEGDGKKDLNQDITIQNLQKEIDSLKEGTSKSGELRDTIAAMNEPAMNHLKEGIPQTLVQFDLLEKEIEKFANNPNPSPEDVAECRENLNTLNSILKQTLYNLEPMIKLYDHLSESGDEFSKLAEDMKQKIVKARALNDILRKHEEGPNAQENRGIDSTTYRELREQLQLARKLDESVEGFEKFVDTDKDKLREVFKLINQIKTAETMIDDDLTSEESKRQIRRVNKFMGVLEQYLKELSQGKLIKSEDEIGKLILELQQNLENVQNVVKIREAHQLEQMNQKKKQPLSE